MAVKRFGPLIKKVKRYRSTYHLHCRTGNKNHLTEQINILKIHVCFNTPGKRVLAHSFSLALVPASIRARLPPQAEAIDDEPKRQTQLLNNGKQP